jgi:polyisoprenoid-binding protein YceI
MSTTVETLTTQLTTGTWAIESTQSKATATATLLGVISVPTVLAITAGSIALRDGNVAIDVRLDPKSVDTRNAKRDEHLRGADFLDVDAYPQASFVALQPWSGKAGSIKGVLTVKGKAVDITLHVTNLAVDSVKNVATFTVTGNVNRDDLGITKAPGFLIKKQLRLHVSVTVRQA